MVWLLSRGVFVALALAMLGLNAPAQAQSYPSKNITIVVSIGAGTGMDVLVRLYAEKLQAVLGKPVVVENKPGAATMLAAAQVASFAAGRPYAGGADQRRDGDQPDALQADQLQPGKRLRADFALCEIAVHPGGQSQPAVQDGAGVHQSRQAGEAAAQLRDGGRRRRCSIFRWSSPSSDSVSTRSMCLTARPDNRSPISPRATSTWASSKPAPRSR